MTVSNRRRYADIRGIRQTKKLTPPEANRSARLCLFSISSLSTGAGDRALFLPIVAVVVVVAAGVVVTVVALVALLAIFGIPKRAARASILATSYLV